MDENKEVSKQKQIDELFSKKPGFFTRLKYQFIFKLYDVRYFLMYKLQIRRSRHIWRLRLHGFNPIMFTELMMEDTFVFETEEEARRAYNTFERRENCDDMDNDYIGKFDGWWYGIDDFNKQSAENKDWNAGINDRFWIKKGYGLDVSEGYVKIIRNNNTDSSLFVPLTNAKL